MVLGQAIMVTSKAARHLLQGAQAEMDNPFHVCLVTKGKHIQHLEGKQKKWVFFFPSVGRMLQTFPPFNCTDFMNYVRDL